MTHPLSAGRATLAAVAASAFVLFSALPAQGQSGPLPLPAVAPVVDCASLTSADLSAAVGAPTHIAAATLVADAKPASYCKVTGTIEPAIKFEVRLPDKNWTQRLLQNGCGGLCGMLSIRTSSDTGCAVNDNGEFVITSTDMGHQGGQDGAWAEDYQKRIDFAYRGVHLTTVAAKALTAKYYGQAQKFAYFSGCSDGGREALMEAQRYPDDFNGIAAGAPAQNFVTQNTFYHGWNVLANLDKSGKIILTADKLPILHKAAVEQCDAADGLKDGLISQPLFCHPDFSSVICKPGADPATCVTQEQANVALELYKGAHDAQGKQLVLSGPLPGSELAWAGVQIPTNPDQKPMSYGASLAVLQHLAYSPSPANFELTDLRFDKATFDATTKLHSLYDAVDPNLKPFAAKGGKLLMYHGYADPHISPLNTIVYYTSIQKLMGKEAADKFTRLYLFPGGYHCGGGEGPFTFDLLTPLMTWVERGQAPDALIAKHVPQTPRQPQGSPDSQRAPRDGQAGPGGPGGQAGPGGPGAPGAAPAGVSVGAPRGADGQPQWGATAKPDRTRPVYPYPFTAKYKGTGSIDDAANFEKGEAKPIPEALFDWFGKDFFSPNYESWCKADGSKFVCDEKAKK